MRFSWDLIRGLAERFCIKLLHIEVIEHCVQLHALTMISVGLCVHWRNTRLRHGLKLYTVFSICSISCCSSRSVFEQTFLIILLG